MAGRVVLSRGGPAIGAWFANQLAQVLVDASVVAVQADPFRCHIVLDEAPDTARTALGVTADEWVRRRRQVGMLATVGMELAEGIPELADWDRYALGPVYTTVPHLYADLWQLGRLETGRVKVEEDHKAREIRVLTELVPALATVEQLSQVAGSWGFPYDVVLVPEGFRPADGEVPRRSSGVLTPARVLGMDLGRAARDFVDADEATWRLEAKTVPAGEVPDGAPAGAKSASCLIDPFPMHRFPLRSLLTLYDRVNIVAQTGIHMEELLAAVAISAAEFDALLEAGRIGLVLPNGWERYGARTLDRVAEVNPNAVLGPRTTAAYVLRDYRTRHPLLFDRPHREERRAILRALYELGEGEQSPVWRASARASIAWLERGWNSGATMLGRRGVSASESHGVAWWATEFLRLQGGTPDFLLMGRISQSVEMASALRSTLVEPASQTFWNPQLAEFLSKVHSGALATTPSPTALQLEIVASGLLRLSEDLPVLEVATAFEGGDIARFREVVTAMIEGAADADALEQCIGAFNRQVAAFEASAAAARDWNLVGLTVASTVVALNVAGKGVWFSPWLAWLLTHAIGRARLPRDEAGHVNRAVDRLQATATRSSPSAPLVARMRSRLPRK